MNVNLEVVFSLDLTAITRQMVYNGKVGLV